MGSNFDNGQHALLQQRYGESLSEDAKYPWNPTISSLLEHVSVRHFLRDEHLPDGTLSTLMAAAQSASTGSMLQSGSVVAVIDLDRKSRVAMLCGDQDFVRQAPLFLLFCADLGRLADASERHGYPGEGAGLERIDLFIMAAQNAAIAAESLGLGMCYVGGARNNARDLADFLNLPRRVVGLFGMAVGKADPAYMNSRKPRLPMNEVVHQDTCKSEDRAKCIAKYEDTLKAHYHHQGKPERPSWTSLLADFASSSDLDGRGRMREVLEEQGFGLS
ncbi:nitroreductase [Fusarium albosuccineum]|uniref:Nitroreductase n=1 Tax=Fusarium albosuccineum TaxID=1237068 RepID=A0A8H4P1L1_9HYPO|nr:nitroreductase [Fusarium albosuccineum]